MRNFLVLAVVLGILSIPMMAQDHSKVEVFGGYQYTRLGGDFPSEIANSNGWDAAVTYKFNRTFGVTADFTGAYKTISGTVFDSPVDVNAHLYTYAFGPVASFNVGKVKPFVHVLFGGAHASLSASSGGASGSVSQNGFTQMTGGGVDVKINKHFAVRLIQADWVYYHFNSGDLFNNSISSGSNAKIATGIVARF